ncbi:hypothetical protein FOZ60_013099 [Perkinsus olseni]|uniref:Uncharacterized protein n=1 Tax=Perkinsus olseni TaxID=32597 RepID=A0A7J6NAD6_PEROL|nr:hypothetical protein FOZ60_013099 [Perkinsus olseni]
MSEGRRSSAKGEQVQTSDSKANVGSTLARLSPRLWDKAISTQRINEACKGLKEYESRLKAEEAVNGDDDGSDRTIVNYFCGIGERSSHDLLTSAR